MLTYLDDDLPIPHLASYTRISDDPKGLAAGVTRQREDNASLATTRWPGLPVVLYEDNDRTAYSGKPRPAYLAMCRAIELRHVTAVVAYNQDRLLRLPVELEAFIDVCMAVRLSDMATASGELDLTTDEGQFKARILAAVAKKASDDTSRRVKRAIQARRARGDHIGPLPYAVTSWTADEITTDPDREAIVRDAYAQLIDGGSLVSVLRWMQATDPDGALRSRVGLRDMMLNTPILTTEQRADLQAILRSPERRVSFTNERRSWLTGILTCDVCNKPLGRNKATNNGRGAWQCHSRHVGIALTPTEDAVRDMILAVSKVRRPAPPPPPVVEPAPDPERERRLANLAQLYMAGELTDAEWRAAREQALPAGTPAPNTHPGLRHSDETARRLAPEVVDAREAWPEWTVVQKHRYAASLLREVRVRRAAQRGRGAWSLERLDPRWRR